MSTQIGQRIGRRLAELDRDQRWLAERLRVSRSAVSRWIGGSRRMTILDLERIALVLHRSPAWLLGESDEVPADSEEVAREAPIGIG